MMDDGPEWLDPLQACVRVIRALLFSLAFLLCLGIILGLMGCASPAPRVEYRTVEIPIAAQCPAPEMPARPGLAISSLSRGDPPEKVVRAYRQSVEDLSAYARDLEALLRAYARP